MAAHAGLYQRASAYFCRWATPAQTAAEDSAVQKRTDNWRDVRDLALFSVALDTGARIGELEALTVDQVDLTYQEITVYGSKDREERTLELGDEAAADLTEWLKQRELLKPADNLSALFISNYRGKGLRPFTH